MIIHGAVNQSVQCTTEGTGRGGEDLRADVAGLPAALLVADLRWAAVLGLRDARRHACPRHRSWVVVYNYM